MVPALSDLKIKLFADGADLAGMIEMAAQPHIAGLTTNPTLMRKAGVKDYSAFAKSVLAEISAKPISFEVFSDELEEMKIQAQVISSWGDNVYVKVPITNTRGESTKAVVKFLAEKGVKVNVTALTTESQVKEIAEVLNPEVPSCISIFAGRIADTGRDPLPIMRESLALISGNNKAELIWASPRELLNIFQANEIGCQIITVTNEILKKLNFVGYNLLDYSLDTVKMFYNDAKSAGFSL